MCWYHPDEASLKYIKHHCECVVNEIRALEKIGDPIGISIESAKQLLDHLYNPQSCKENKDVN